MNRLLTESLLVLFRAIARGAAEGAVLEVQEHGGPQHRASATIPADPHADHVPTSVLGLLERSASPLTVSAAKAAVRVVRREFPKVYVNASDPASPYGKDWHWPVAELEAWETGLEGGPCPPTLVVHALPAAFAVWALTEPAGPVELPLPGSQVASMEPRVVEVVQVDESRIYHAGAVEKALAAAAAAATAAVKAAMAEEVRA